MRLQCFAVGVVALAVLGLSPPVAASPIGGGELPMLTVRVDGEVQEVALPTNAQGTGFAMPETTLDFSGGSVTLTDVSGFFDPVLNLAAAATDTGAPSQFMVALTSPLNPALLVDNPYITDLGGTFTDGGPGGAGELGRITLTAFQPGGVMAAQLNGTTIDLLGGSQIFNGPATLQSYGPFAGGGNYDCGPGPGCTTFGIVLAFGGSGNNDTYALNSRFEIPTAPEPGALLLITGALAAFAARRRGRA